MENEFCKSQKDENNRIEFLKRKLVDSKKNDSKPKAVLLGGTPGAGKTQLCNSVLQKNKGSEYVVIDVDDYRKYSPVFSNKNNNLSVTKMVELSSEFCNKVASELLEYALKNRKNIIINTSLREKDLILNFINYKFIPAGYKIDICVLSTSIEECILSSQERYEKQIEEKEFPRFTTIKFIKDSESKIKETIKELENIKEIGAIEIYIRGKDKNTLPIKVYSTKDKLKRYRNAIEAIENCKKEEKRKHTNEEQLARVRKLYEKRKNRSATEEEFKVLSEIIEYYKENSNSKN